MIINLSIEEFYSTNDGSKFNEPKTQKKKPKLRHGSLSPCRAYTQHAELDTPSLVGHVT